MQKRAIYSPFKPILVLMEAGIGKTKGLETRISEFIMERYFEHSILLINYEIIHLLHSKKRHELVSLQNFILQLFFYELLMSIPFESLCYYDQYDCLSVKTIKEPVHNVSIPQLVDFSNSYLSKFISKSEEVEFIVPVCCTGEFIWITCAFKKSYGGVEYSSFIQGIGRLEENLLL